MVEIETYRASEISTCLIDNIIPYYELKKAKQYKKINDQQMYLKARIVLRQALAEKLTIGPKEVSITIDSYGKPHTDGVHFNISHSNKYIALALSDKTPVGVDIQYHDKNIAKESMCDLFMSLDEHSAFKLKPCDNEQIKFFYDIWTRKESLIKAEGSGFLNRQFLHTSTLKNKVTYMNKLYNIKTRLIDIEYSLSICQSIS